MLQHIGIAELQHPIKLLCKLNMGFIRQRLASNIHQATMPYVNAHTKGQLGTCTLGKRLVLLSRHTCMKHIVGSVFK